MFSEGLGTENYSFNQAILHRILAFAIDQFENSV